MLSMISLENIGFWLGLIKPCLKCWKRIFLFRPMLLTLALDGILAKRVTSFIANRTGAGIFLSEKGSSSGKASLMTM